MTSDDTRARANEEENYAAELHAAADKQRDAEAIAQEASDAKDQADKDAENT